MLVTSCLFVVGVVTQVIEWFRRRVLKHHLRRWNCIWVEYLGDLLRLVWVKMMSMLLMLHTTSWCQFIDVHEAVEIASWISLIWHSTRCVDWITSLPCTFATHWSEIRLASRHLVVIAKVSIVSHIHLLLCLSWSDACDSYLRLIMTDIALEYCNVVWDKIRGIVSVILVNAEARRCHTLTLNQFRSEVLNSVLKLIIVIALTRILWFYKNF